MKAVRLHGIGDLRLDEIDAPRPGPDDVVVQVAACGICGSDLGYVETGGISAPVSEPIGLGHELSGVVAAVGANVVGVTPGQRVAVNPLGGGKAIGNGSPEGGFAPFLLIRGARLGEDLHPIPDQLPFETAALTEPLSVALHAVNRAELAAGAKVAVFGAGPIGLGITLFLRQRGIEDIVVVDMSDGRLERARKLGASVTLNPGRDDLQAGLAAVHGSVELYGQPCAATQCFFEASGGRGVLPSIIAMAPFHASVVVVAVHHEPVPIDFLTVLAKEMTLTSAMAYPTEFGEVVNLLARGAIDPAPLVSHSFALEEFEAAFAAARDRERSAKVIIRMPI